MNKTVTDASNKRYIADFHCFYVFTGFKIASKNGDNTDCISKKIYATAF